jgi:outer membrane protein TolC
MIARSIYPVFAVVLTLMGPASVFAQSAEPLTLPRAVAIALENNPLHKMAFADTASAQSQVSMAKSSFLPRITFSETATIGNDAVYAFGTRLRQARFTQNDFALNNLNHPEPIGDFASRFGGEWNLFDSFGKTYQLRRAKLLGDSSAKQLNRTDQELVFRVIDAYYSIELARKQVEVAEQTLKTAQALLDSSKARVETGSAVESDALSAQVNVATRQQDLIQAQNAQQLARAQLETVLGTPLGPDATPSTALREAALQVSPLEEEEARALQQRPDLRAMADQIAAQQNSLKAAKAAYGPRLNVFGAWQSDNSSMFANGSSNWLTGAELRIDLFSRDREARVAGEKASLSRVEAARKMAEDNIRLDVRRAWLEHDASRQMLDVSRASVQQADESLRIVHDRYDSGLVTITDLLRTEDAHRMTQTNYWQSVYRYIVSYAALELAAGDLTSRSPVVTQ